MMSRCVACPIALALALAAAGCAPWAVIRESGPPSALKGASRIEVSFDYSIASLGGVGEAEWLARQPPDDQGAYMEVKRNMDEAFLEAFARQVGVPVTMNAGTPPAPDAAHLIVRYTFIEQGKYAVVFAMDSEVHAVLAWARGGQITDEIEVKRRIAATITRPAIIQRMRVATDALGELGARFFREAQDT